MIVSRVLASLAHLGLVLGLLGIGWRHFDRPLTGMAMVACYLLLPYTRMALVDSAQLIPSALIVAAVFWHLRPALAGALIGLAGGWMPACLGLIALWCGFFRGRGAIRFVTVALAVVICCALFGRFGPALVGDWARGLGARSIAEVGLLPHFQPRSEGSFWVSIDSSFRLPVLIAYLGSGDPFQRLAGREKPGRADLALGSLARRQPVLVPREGGYVGDALSSAGDRHDVPSDPFDSPAVIAGTSAPGGPAFALSFFLIQTRRFLLWPSIGDWHWRNV